MHRTTTIELYEMDTDGWYVTIKKTKDDDTKFYTIEKENSDNIRSKTSIQINEEQFGILVRLIDEMSKVKE